MYFSIVYRIVFIFLFVFCHSADLDSQDSIAVRPKEVFAYGSALSLGDCKNLEEYLELLEITDGQIIAEIGAADAYTLAAFSVVLDSATLYAQDINKKYLNEESFLNVTDYYNRLRTASQTNGLNYVIGKKKKTNLPKGIFDAVFIKNSFHEFSNKKAMLQDISALLNDSGRVIISDEFTTYKKGRKVIGCNHDALKYDELYDAMADVGLYPIQMLTLRESWWNTLIFSKDHSRSVREFKELSIETELDQIVGQVQDLNSEFFVRNARNVDNLKRRLLKAYPEIVASGRYYHLETWIASIAREWLKKKEYSTALGIANILIESDPNQSSNYMLIASIYAGKKDYQSALKYYRLAEKLDPNSIYVGYLGEKSLIELLEDKLD